MTPTGFWSYARGDDDHLDGALSRLRKQVEGEVSMLLGEEVDIFQDIYDLRTGDNWAEKLRGQVTAASFFIPVLTPRFFKRPWCREEVTTFLRIAREQGVEPRVFPIIFVHPDPDPNCEVRTALKPYQYKDFSQWRFEADATKRARLLNEFARDVKERLKLPDAAVVQPAPPQVTTAASDTVIAASAPAALSIGEKAEALTAATPPTQPTLVVDPFPGRGHHTRIGDAIAAAEPGARILVREGTYRETLRLSKPLEIIGEGDRERILVVTTSGDTLQCDSFARVAGLRFRREAGGKDFGVWITGGAPEFEDCIIESLSLSVVAVMGETARPSFRRCVLRNGDQSGLSVFEGAQVSAEDCEFVGNALAGAAVSGHSTHATFRRCVSRDGKASGFFFFDSGTAVLESCEAVGNSLSGISIRQSADVLLRECIVRENKSSGCSVTEAGKLRMLGGAVRENHGAGIVADTGGKVDVKSCSITGNGLDGVWIKDSVSSGTFKDNDLRGNVLGAWDLAEGASIVREGNIE